MARIRTIKPEFWTDGRMVRLSPLARLLYIGSWNFALCDQGHLPDDPMELKLKVLPADDADPDELVEELVSMGRLVRKTTHDGRRYLHIVRLSEHQKVDTRWRSRCPYCIAEAKAAADGTTEPPPDSPDHTDPCETSPRLTETRARRGESPQASPQKSGGGGRKVGTKNSSSPGDTPAPGDSNLNSGVIPGMPSGPTPLKPPRPGSDDDPDWVKFWSVFPNSAGKADARKAWAKAVKKAAPFVIIAGAERYRDYVTRAGTAKKYIKHASGWLNGERWNDELPNPDETHGNANGTPPPTGPRADVNSADWSNGFNLGGRR